MPFVRMSFALVTSHLGMTNGLAYLAGATIKNKRAFLGLAAWRVLNQSCPLPNAIKLFYGRKFTMFVRSWSVSPWQAFRDLSNVCV